MNHLAVKLALAVLEKKLATMSRDDVVVMERELRASEKAETEVGRAMLAMLEGRLQRK